ncbi:hypothetical protein NM688_g4662 [Phlebia brevispora]|uniref:Uncharacterized protein n=1 Tax=Phlebia brevispora TaxID=194682 RepID=A0ACC1T2G1_9APHY|nr:hypothetical protein NM688_g4662 [Phlebia brevispora]
MALSHALRLRWLLLPLCLVQSSLYGGAILPGLALTVGIFLHNELLLDSHWFTRNVCNALGCLLFLDEKNGHSANPELTYSVDHHPCAGLRRRGRRSPDGTANAASRIP